MPNEKRRIHFAHDIIGKKRVSFSFYGINCYLCRPIVKHPSDDKHPKKGKDLYLICENFPGEKMPDGKRKKRKVEIIVCFQWCSPKSDCPESYNPKTYRRVKTYLVSKLPAFEAHFIVGYAMKKYLIDKLGYHIENWMDIVPTTKKHSPGSN